MSRHIYLMVGMPGECKEARLEEIRDGYDNEEWRTINGDQFTRGYYSHYAYITNDKLRLRSMVSAVEDSLIFAMSTPELKAIGVNVEIPSVEIALILRLHELISDYNGSGDSDFEPCEPWELHIEPVWTAREVSMRYMYECHEGHYDGLPREVMEKEYEENYHTLASLYLQHKITKQESVNPYFTLMTPDDTDSVPHAIVVDMDDTMCFNTSGRHYVGEDAHVGMYDDTPNFGALCMVWNWLDSPDRKAGDRVIVLTGRDDEREQEVTCEWWRKWLGDDRYKKANILYLGRKKGSGMTTVAAKVKNYNAEVKGKYCVDFMLEDRPDIADIFRDDYGLWVFQTIKPYYGSCCF